MVKGKSREPASIPHPATFVLGLFRTLKLNSSSFILPSEQRISSSFFQRGKTKLFFPQPGDPILDPCPAAAGKLEDGRAWV